MRTDRPAWGVAVALATAACAGSAEDLGSSREPPGIANPGSGASASGGAGAVRGSFSGASGGGTAGTNTPDGGTGASAGGTTGTTGAGGASGTGGAAAVPPDILREPTVWIGEVSPPVSYPTDWTPGATEKVILVLDAITQGVVTGTITFGEASAPAQVGTNPLGTDTNWLFSPSPGFSYSLLASELKGDRLAVNFAPVELWTDTCAAEVPTMATSTFCDCTTTPCRANNQPLRKLDLVVTGNTMAGEVTRPPGNWLGSVPEIKLQRVQ